MVLQNEQIIFVRTDPELWDFFTNQDGVHALPKYTYIIKSSEGKICSLVDSRVIPECRNSKHASKASNWLTHLSIMEQFVKSDKQFLFVCEDSILLNESDIQRIEVSSKKGLVLLADKAKAYIVDKYTASIIVKNSYVYYDDFAKVLEDMKQLNLISLNHSMFLKTRTAISPIIMNIVLVLFLLFFSAGIFYMLCPLYRPSTKNFIGLAKVLTTKESIMS